LIIKIKKIVIAIMASFDFLINMIIIRTIYLQRV
jgi:hypothetical protein